MTDLVKLLIKAGNGGNGAISFRREKYVPKGGPDGGDGGRGGDVMIRASRHLSSLDHLSGVKQVVADDGASGESRQKAGRDAEPKVIEVPVGTTVWIEREFVRPHGWRRRGLAPLKKSQVKLEQYSLAYEDDPINQLVEATVLPEPEWMTVESKQQISGTNLKGEKLVELIKDGQAVLVCQGGFGGRGNAQFKSSRETTPRRAELGSLGEVREVILELKLLADVGLLGFPSVGKSTLLSTLTSARPKIAAYPFTTLEPNLGILNLGDKNLVVADLPGLIEGASQGKGLGYRFLRHAEHCSLLVMVLAFDESVLFDEKLSDGQKIKVLANQYQQLKKEMLSYHLSFSQKPKLVVVSKADLLNQKLQQKIITNLKKLIDNHQPLLISAATNFGLEQFRQELLGVLSKHQSGLLVEPVD